jgi:ribose/xylose/arabinose/galactoside ABC-type transport system permease subunit
MTSAATTTTAAGDLGHFTDNRAWSAAYLCAWTGTVFVSLAALLLFLPLHELRYGIFLEQWLPAALLAAPMVMIVAAGGVDLSVGAVATLAGIIVATLAPESGFWTALAAAMAVALGVGLVNAGLVCLLGVHPVLATLGMSLAAPLAGLLLSEQRVVSFQPPWPDLWKSSLATAAAIAAVVAVGAVLAHLTPLARRAGAHTRRPSRFFYVGLPYVLSSLAAGLAGVLYLWRFQAADPTMGANREFTVLLAVVMAGTVWGGGLGNAVGAALAALAVTLMNSAFVYEAVPSWVQTPIQGAGIILFAALGTASYRVVDWAYRRRAAA